MEKPKKEYSKNEGLVKQVNDIFNIFFGDERGNRLSQFSFGAFKELVLKMIRDYDLYGHGDGGEIYTGSIKILKKKSEEKK